MNGKLEYKTTKGNMTRFQIDYKGWKYWGWICPNTEEFKINRRNDKYIETLGWAYYAPNHTADKSCDDCEENTCFNCPCSYLEQAGWDYEDLQAFLKKVNF